MKINNSSTNFSQLVKEEICNSQKFDKNQQILLIYTIIKNIGEIDILNGSIEFKIRYLYLLNLIKSILDTNLSNLNYEILKSNKKTLGDNKTNFLIRIFDKNSEIFNNITNYFKDYNFKSKNLNIFLIGCFLTSGSISRSLKSQNHFEIRIIDTNFCKFLQKVFKKFKLIPKIIKHKNKYVLYFKKSEEISDILKILGATESMFIFEDNRIEHDFINNMQRLINLEVSNIQKISKASVELVSKCKVLMTDYRYDYLTVREKLFCQIRVKFPMLSLKEISLEMNKFLPLDKPINKGSLSHIVRKIRKLYDELFLNKI